MSILPKVVFAQCRHCGRQNMVARAVEATIELTSTTEHEFTCKYCGYEFCVPGSALQIRDKATLQPKARDNSVFPLIE
jgi:hypothetical protein